VNFISTEYAVLLVATLVLVTMASGRLVTYTLLAASVVFYGWWSPIYLTLLLAVIVLSWLGALIVDRWRNRIVLAAVIVGELSLLLYFKYAGFVVQNIRDLGQWLGHPVTLARPSILLPVGISFMTFQGVAYVVDVYRRELAPVRSLVEIALFKSFFPQLVAGPIERGPHLLPQLRRLELGAARDAPLPRATFMIMKGVFLKFVIADNMSTVVDAVYSNVAAANPLDVVLAVYAFSVQIYCDFYGYTMIALGSALLFNVELVNNFRHPYLATSIQEFWRRWHISLSTWFRDYLYIPLGGSHVSWPRHAINLLIVMFAVGLWHGANWTFVVWGAAHGAMLAAYATYRRLGRSSAPRLPAGVGAVAGWFVTFTAVTLAWIPFRAPNLEAPGLILRKVGEWIAHPAAFRPSLPGYEFYLWLAAVFAIFEVIDGSWDLDEAFVEMPAAAQAAVLFLFCAATYLGPFKDVAFLYFQF
jgi:D-alanyl-lipoteichoic acid acyltransferase DltB (MBOAT superfamily)